MGRHLEVLKRLKVLPIACSKNGTICPDLGVLVLSLKRPTLSRNTVRSHIEAVIGPASGMRIWLVAGFTDLYILRGRSGNKIKVLWAGPKGMCCLYKRLNDGRFVWSQTQNGTVSLSAAQPLMLLEGIDWRQPRRARLSPQDLERKPPSRV
jgi:hypothetical protein